MLLSPVLLLACSSTTVAEPTDVPPEPADAAVEVPAVEHVIASYYGERFRGRRTASGEIFDPDGFTAAHKTLPLGSMVKVTNPDDGRAVVVRVNDRGPHVRGRAIDLSKAAAQQIGLLDDGVDTVQLELL